mmetsp:Transcript_119579/g.208200  ORF Transcript_119579/g.208200 Transcript_119579/m.208200 type:complete len:306 (+) Transcript_119579:68-985(+)
MAGPGWRASTALPAGLSAPAASGWSWRRTRSTTGTGPSTWRPACTACTGSSSTPSTVHSRWTVCCMKKTPNGRPCVPARPALGGACGVQTSRSGRPLAAPGWKGRGTSTSSSSANRSDATPWSWGNAPTGGASPWPLSRRRRGSAVRGSSTAGTGSCCSGRSATAAGCTRPGACGTSRCSLMIHGGPVCSPFGCCTFRWWRWRPGGVCRGGSTKPSCGWPGSGWRSRRNIGGAGWSRAGTWRGSGPISRMQPSGSACRRASKWSAGAATKRRGPPLQPSSRSRAAATTRRIARRCSAVSALGGSS